MRTLPLLVAAALAAATLLLPAPSALLAGEPAGDEIVNKMCGAFTNAEKKAACLATARETLNQGEPGVVVVRMGCGVMGKPGELVDCYRLAALEVRETMLVDGTANCIARTDCMYERLGCMVGLYSHPAVPQTRMPGTAVALAPAPK